MSSTAETFDLAWQHHQAGNFAQAEYLYGQVLQSDPSHADAWCFRGAAYQAQGKLAEAETNLRRAVELLPSHASAQNYLGIVLAQQGRLAEAVAVFQRLLAILPTDAEAHSNLGLVLTQLGQIDQAIACYQRALQLKPDFTAARNNLNQVLQQRPTVAAPVRSSDGSPQLAYDANRRGVALAQEGRLDEANACFEQALQFEPGNADAHVNLGTILDIRQQYDEAVARYHQALRLKPDHVEAHYNLGTVLDKQGKVEEAITSMRRAIALDPGHLDAHNNLGNVLRSCGRMEEALACFDHTLRIKPNYGEGHLSRAALWLLQGDFERGWPEYEWRWKRVGFVERTFPQPMWDGSDLKGRTVLLYAEQGLGDTIQFVRYAPLVKKRGGRVIVECQRELLRLLESAPGIDQLVAQGAALPEFEVRAPLPSLPGIFHTGLDTIPQTVPYLAADADLVEKWRSELKGQGGFKVGIAWQGNPAHRDDLKRSIPLTQFARLVEVPGVQLFSLQKGHGTEQLGALADRFSVLDLSSRLEDFTDTAAVAKNLDLVISCDSAVAHLAGALGVPVCLALPLGPDWRWLQDREDSPWYPSMRLFRQTRYGDWDGVFERLTAAVTRKPPRLARGRRIKSS